MRGGIPGWYKIAPVFTSSLAAPLVAHLVYGFSMGVVYAELAAQTPPSEDAVGDAP